MNTKSINRRGFTIVECVVAMAIIVLVSVAAISIISRAAVNSEQDILLTYARVDASNALELFKACEASELGTAITSELGFAKSGDTYTKAYGNELRTEIRIYSDGQSLFFKATVTADESRKLINIDYEKRP